MDNKEKLEELIRETLVEEGVMDWLFSRWRKGGSWKGNKLSGKETGVVGQFIEELEKIHKAMGALQQSYPRKSKLIKANLLRAIRDLEDLLISIERGRSEKDIDEKYPIS